MNKSEAINELAAALSKMQGEMDTVKKDADNPFFKSRYSTLAACWECARAPLAKNGLSVVQTTTPDAVHVIVETMLMHSSGQYIASTIQMNPGYINKEGEFIPEGDSQAYGSCLTYARRYGLMAILGIAPDDDDDAESASSHKTLSRNTPVQPNRNLEKEADDIYISDAQRKRLFAICGEHKVTEAVLKEMLAKRLIDSSKKITRKEYDQICGIIPTLATVQPAVEEPLQEAPAEDIASWKMCIIPIGKKFKGKRLGIVDKEAQEYYMNEWLPKQDREKLSAEEKFFAGAIEEMALEMNVEEKV